MKGRRRKVSFRIGPVHIRWSGIIAGMVAALGFWLLLYCLGLALGLSTISPDNPDSAKTSGIFEGVWGLVSPLVALFLGAFVAARSSDSVERVGGAIHGVVMWGATMILGAFLVTTALSSVIGGAASVGKTALQTSASAVTGKNVGLDTNAVLGPINQKLQSEGKPAITADQLDAATKDLVNQGVTRGGIDHQTLVSSIAQNTNLSQQDAEDVANRVQGQLDQTKQNVQHGALQAADTTGKVFWAVFGALALGLLAALFGGYLGGGARDPEELTVTTTVR